MSWQCQADSDPTCQFENKFARLGDLDARDAREKQVRIEDPKHDKYAQDRASQKICFLDLLDLGTDLMLDFQCIQKKPRSEHQYVDLLIRHFNFR